jgi:retron-type reverse transcriptase
MSKIQFQYTYNDIISFDNLLLAWKEFVHGKKSRKDVQEFERNLMANIISLHNDLVAKTYSHLPYQAFKISDPKPRDIHKASVRDRLLHHALQRMLYTFFERIFISDSYSCQTGKGTHRALRRFDMFSRKISKNNTRTIWVLKCDIKKFFANIDHAILLGILQQYIPDQEIVRLITSIVNSFNSGTLGKGLPLGNLTSQLLVNIYMNEFDQFMKHGLRQKYYIRYADDFAIMHEDQGVLMEVLFKVHEFLDERLKLKLHPDKVSIKTVASGVDFLGWVHFQTHRVLRTVTKQRMFKKIIAKQGKEEVVQSYLGLLSHGNTHKLQKSIKEQFPTKNE